MYFYTLWTRKLNMSEDDLGIDHFQNIKYINIFFWRKIPFTRNLKAC